MLLAGALCAGSRDAQVFAVVAGCTFDFCVLFFTVDRVARDATGLLGVIPPSRTICRPGTGRAFVRRHAGRLVSDSA
jgi:hypothetical protein